MNQSTILQQSDHCSCNMLDSRKFPCLLVSYQWNHDGTGHKNPCYAAPLLPSALAILCWHGKRIKLPNIQRKFDHGLVLVVI